MSFFIEGVIKNYDWGKIGNNSLVNKIYYSKNRDKLDYVSFGNNLTSTSGYYAELWFGTHELGKSNILNDESDISINSIISKYMNKKYQNIYNDDIPFILKVLSIRKPLSIQFHPTKEQAIYLNKSNPEVYKDNNKKCEMALALSDDFELLYGFDNYENVKLKFSHFPKIINIPSFKNILNGTNEYIKDIINIIKDELITIEENNKTNFIKLINNLINQYDNDKGVLLAFYMRHVCLKKGESIFIAPNILHSYLKGDIIEITSKSDNVLRLGLTHKYIDIDNINLIINDYTPTKESIIKPKIIKNHLYYIPPINDFQIINLNTNYLKLQENPIISIKKNIIELPNIYPLIIIILEGNGYLNSNKKFIQKGDSLLIVKNETIINFSDNLNLICGTINTL
jgi:mannose-6-phosphate isomerase